MSTTGRRNIALVLSSGGARGMAHSGVIEAFEQNGFNITSISGTSMGAVVGGIYAAGKLTEFNEWASTLDKADIFKLLDFTFSRQGFIRGEKIFNELRGIVGNTNIEELQIPFSAIAAELNSRQEVVFTSGCLFEAMRASVSIPTLMQPLLLQNRILVDGGIVNPVPVNRVQRQPGDLLAVVNVCAAIPCLKPIRQTETAEQVAERMAEREAYQTKARSFLSKWIKSVPRTDTSTKVYGFLDLLNSSFDLLQDRLVEMCLEKYQPDILINISRSTCGTFEFYRANELFEDGKTACEKAIHEWEQKEQSLSFTGRYNRFMQGLGLQVRS